MKLALCKVSCYYMANMKITAIILVLLLIFSINCGSSGSKGPEKLKINPAIQKKDYTQQKPAPKAQKHEREAENEPSKPETTPPVTMI